MIRREHLKANISTFEHDPYCLVQWNDAMVDRGGTIFGPGPYLKVRVTVGDDAMRLRVYPTARVRRKILARGYEGQS